MNFKKYKSILLSIIIALTFIFTGCSKEVQDNISNKVDSSTKTDISISDLKNTENFKNGAIEHILEGEINSQGKAVGFHYEGLKSSKGRVIEGTESKENEYGVYTAEVEVDGVKKTSNKGKSSFFPKDLSPQQVIDAINEAYKDREYKSGNEYYGYAKSGMKISMYIDENTDKIISAFPQY